MDLIKVQIFGLSTAGMKINQIPYVIFQATSPFPFKIFILGLLMKVHQIPHAIFETKRSGFLKFCITVQCHER